MMAYFKNIGSASAWSRYSVLKSTLFVFQNVDISISPIGGETGGSENLSTSCELHVCEAGAAQWAEIPKTWSRRLFADYSRYE
jgi:hypothetical protein